MAQIDGGDLVARMLRQEGSRVGKRLCRLGQRWLCLRRSALHRLQSLVQRYGAAVPRTLLCVHKKLEIPPPAALKRLCAEREQGEEADAAQERREDR